jgi:NhaP-type Na+/H+ or K+/H+ antiporter
MPSLVQTVVAAVFLGILAQIVAHRFKLPAILPLLIAGMACGPQGLRLFDPATLGHGLEVIIHLGVAVILFEGSLSLELRQLRRVGDALGNLLTVGAVVTGIASAWLAKGCLGLSWSTAALFGAVVTVTGPTVIAPLLRHLIAPKKVRTLLLSEGLMIDAIGAVLAYLVLLWIERAGLGFRAVFTEILVLSAVGCVLGFVAGSLASLAIRQRFLADEHRNLAILALLWGSFLVAERQAPTSGILAAVVMGLTVSAAKLPDVSPLKAFKGQLTVLMISVLFILLSGHLDLRAVFDLGWGGVGVVAGMILLVRPLSVLLSLRRGFDWREKTMVALTAPRGIVAAAVASLSAIQLRDAGQVADARLLEGLVYLVILSTCVWATLVAVLLPRWLGYAGDPSRRRIFLIGAHPLAAALARALAERGWQPTVVDSVAAKLEPLQHAGIGTVCGDARDAATYDDAGVERDAVVVAMTLNDELNVLAAELIRDEFGVEHPAILLRQAPSEFGSRRRAWMDLVGGREIDLPRWNEALSDETARLGEWVAGTPEKLQWLRAKQREQPHRVAVLCSWRDGRPQFAPISDGARDARFTVLADEQIWRELAA